MTDATNMAAVVRQANKVKKMVIDKALSQVEDPAVVKARELASDARLKEEALERRIRELAHSRSARIALNGAAINDDFARLLAKELGKMTAALPKVEAAGAAGAGAAASSSRLSDAARYDPSTLIDESDTGSDEEGEGYVRLRDVKWPDDPVIAQDAPDTSDSDSERSFRFTPRDERVFIASEPIKYFNKVLTAPYVPPGSRQQLDGLEGPAGRGCAVLELSKNQIGGKGCAYVCGWLRVSALHTLVLSDNPLGDSGVTLLGRAIYHAAQLRSLALQRCGATEYGIRHLATGVGRSSTLRQLWLMDNEARCDGARHLMSALSVAGCGLTELGLERNNVGAAGAQALAAALARKHCTLTELRLQHNPLGTEGVIALARALDSTNAQLRVLKLRGCGAADAGGLALAHALGKNRSLASLGLEDNELTLLCTRALRQAMLKGGVLQRLSFDLSQGGIFTRPRDVADLEGRKAPPSPPPKPKSGQRKHEAQQALAAAVKYKDWSSLIHAVGAVDEYGNARKVKKPETESAERARRLKELRRRKQSKAEQNAAALMREQERLHSSFYVRRKRSKAKDAGRNEVKMKLLITLYKSIDPDGDGGVTLDELHHALVKRPAMTQLLLEGGSLPPRSTVADLHEALDGDGDGDGYATFEEMKNLFGLSGVSEGNGVAERYSVK